MTRRNSRYLGDDQERIQIDPISIQDLLTSLMNRIRSVQHQDKHRLDYPWSFKRETGQSYLLTNIQIKEIQRITNIGLRHAVDSGLMIAVMPRQEDDESPR